LQRWHHVTMAGPTPDFWQQRFDAGQTPWDLGPRRTRPATAGLAGQRRTVMLQRVSSLLLHWQDQAVL